VTVHRERHAMMRRARLWHRLTTSYVLAVLAGVEPRGADAPTAHVVTQVLAGKPSLVV
jgi:hypothetical protein